MPEKAGKVERVRGLQRPAEAALAAAGDEFERLLARKRIADDRRELASRPWAGNSSRVSQRRGRSGNAHAPLMDVHPPQLGAAMELRKDLAGIEQPLGIEGAFEALLLVEIELR